MRKFTDANGHEWTIRLNVGLVEDVRQQTEVNIAWDDWDWADLLVKDFSKFVAVIYALVEKQADAKNVTRQDFAYGFDGPTLEAAGRTLGQALADFFPFEKHRSSLLGNAAAIFDPVPMASPLPMNAPESVASILEPLVCAN